MTQNSSMEMTRRSFVFVIDGNAFKRAIVHSSLKSAENWARAYKPRCLFLRRRGNRVLLPLNGGSIVRGWPHKMLLFWPNFSSPSSWKFFSWILCLHVSEGTNSISLSVIQLFEFKQNWEASGAALETSSVLLGHRSYFWCLPFLRSLQDLPIQSQSALTFFFLTILPLWLKSKKQRRFSHGRK